jgi:hypothetical protein
MAAQLAAGIPPAEERCGFEFKWDGIRAIAFYDGGRQRLQTRNRNDVTRRYPELAPLGDALGSHQAVLDGEIVALDAKGRPSFETLQQRMGLTAEAEVRQVMARVPVSYVLQPGTAPPLSDWRPHSSMLGLGDVSLPPKIDAPAANIRATLSCSTPSLP